ncbi:MAG: Na+/H+ antiporter NhaA [Microbacteriaceae bacterium]
MRPPRFCPPWSRPSLRSERLAATLLLAAAAIGLALANSPLAAAALAARDARWGPESLELSTAQWISDGLLAVFFLVAAIELGHELRLGELSSPARALRPAIAAGCGVLVPALLYLALAAGSGEASGWPIPTATDVAFALGVLALLGRGLPAGIRAFVLALAVLDDLIAILVIAVLFTDRVDVVDLVLAALCLLGVGVLSRVPEPWLQPVTAVLALVVWYLVHDSGVHATIAGVAVGLVLPRRGAARLRHALEPWVNGGVLPLYALSAAMVAIPAVGLGGLSAPFWAILLALPIGKLLGISAGAWLGAAVQQRRLRPRVSVLELLAVGALGGVGFTVSLLLAELAFAEEPRLRAEATLAVLAGSSVGMLAGGLLVAALARRVRRGDDGR